MTGKERKSGRNEWFYPNVQSGVYLVSGWRLIWSVFLSYCVRTIRSSVEAIMDSVTFCLLFYDATCFFTLTFSHLGDLFEPLCPPSYLLLPHGCPCFPAPAPSALRFMRALQSDISGRGKKGINSPQGVAAAPAGGTPDSHAPLTYLAG